MPIEIKELHIKVTIQDAPKQSPITHEKIAEEISPSLKKEIMEECVERVLEILERKFED
ncbi:MAG: DUF5908 family protein [Raineya sp.]|jgi:hypothetical protein|nr:DUF5908 family protein [Raineya sp.]